MESERSSERAALSILFYTVIYIYRKRKRLEMGSKNADHLRERERDREGGFAEKQMELFSAKMIR